MAGGGDAGGGWPPIGVAGGGAGGSGVPVDGVGISPGGGDGGDPYVTENASTLVSNADGYEMILPEEFAI